MWVEIMHFSHSSIWVCGWKSWMLVISAFGFASGDLEWCYLSVLVCGWKSEGDQSFCQGFVWKIASEWLKFSLSNLVCWCIVISCVSLGGFFKVKGTMSVKCIKRHLTFLASKPSATRFHSIICHYKPEYYTNCFECSRSCLQWGFKFSKIGCLPYPLNCWTFHNWTLHGGASSWARVLLEETHFCTYTHTYTHTHTHRGYDSLFITHIILRLKRFGEHEVEWTVKGELLAAGEACKTIKTCCKFKLRPLIALRLEQSEP